MVGLYILDKIIGGFIVCIGQDANQFECASALLMYMHDNDDWGNWTKHGFCKKQMVQHRHRLTMSWPQALLEKLMTLSWHCGVNC